MVKIIGAGLCRTGTTSTVVALDSFGFGPVYHYNEVRLRPGEGTSRPRMTLTDPVQIKLNRSNSSPSL